MAENYVERIRSRPFSKNLKFGLSEALGALSHAGLAAFVIVLAVGLILATPIRMLAAFLIEVLGPKLITERDGMIHRPALLRALGKIHDLGLGSRDDDEI